MIKLDFTNSLARHQAAHLREWCFSSVNVFSEIYHIFTSFEVVIGSFLKVH